ncbi:MAG: TlpA family protein disulfide reductase [Bacteroidota bacterium]
MKYNLIKPLIITAILSIGCTNKSLKVKLEQNDIQEASLYNTETFEADTFVINGNSFSVNPGYVKGPTLYYLMFDGINNAYRPIYLILSKKPTIVEFDKLKAVKYNSSNIRDLYPNRPILIKDPNNNNAFYDFQELWLNFYTEIQNPEYNLEDRKELHEKFINASENIIYHNIDKLVSAVVVEYLMRNNLIDLEKTQSYYSNLDDKIKASAIGKRLRKEAGLEPRSHAPDFTLRDYHGNLHKLDSLKGEKVLLHFWSTTCSPCIKQVPLLLDLSEKHQDLVIINISLDTDKERWISGMNEHGISEMINCCDLLSRKSKIVEDYHINYIPANYLIDENGLIDEQKALKPKLIIP